MTDELRTESLPRRRGGPCGAFGDHHGGGCPTPPLRMLLAYRRDGSVLGFVAPERLHPAPRRLTGRPAPLLDVVLVRA